MRGVLVVGASSPIGQAIARSFTSSGDTVVGASLTAAESAETPWAAHLTVDCSTAEGAETAVQAVVAEAGRLDVVVLAAAAMPVAPITGTTDAQWQTAMNAVLGTAFATSRAAIPLLTAAAGEAGAGEVAVAGDAAAAGGVAVAGDAVAGRGGAIVAVSSVNAFLAAPGLAAYAAAKAGLEGLVRQLALEYGPQGVRVNAVAPGMIGGEGIEKAAAGYPLGRTGTPEEVAQAVHFLADATFVTGVVLPVDGGLSIASPAAFLREDLRRRWRPAVH